MDCYVFIQRGHTVIEHICNNDIDSYMKKGRIKIVPINKTPLILEAKKEMDDARKKYNSLLNKLFNEIEGDKE